VGKLPTPLIAVSASRMEMAERRHPIHGAGAKNIDAVMNFANGIPVLIPAVADALDVEELVSRIDGVLLTGGRANVEPHHFDGAPFPPEEPIDPGRDGVVLPLVRACVAAQVPVFGVCRGIQEMNVALGGSLHYRCHLVPGMEDHRMPRHPEVTQEEIFKLRHEIFFPDGSSFHGYAGAPSAMVNSLHGQSVHRLAGQLQVEASTRDGVIEAVRLKDDATFTVGVQWHAEWKPEEHALSRALFQAFGEAAQTRAAARL
jgi:putative glutamine amidotransferase